MTKRFPCQNRWKRVAGRKSGGCYRSTERACVVPRACWREIFSEKLRMRVKKEKRSKKERQEGLWKLTLLGKSAKNADFPSSLKRASQKTLGFFTVPTGPTTNINSKTYAD